LLAKKTSFIGSATGLSYIGICTPNLIKSNLPYIYSRISLELLDKILTKNFQFNLYAGQSFILRICIFIAYVLRPSKPFDRKLKSSILGGGHESVTRKCFHFLDSDFSFFGNKNSYLKEKNAFRVPVYTFYWLNLLRIKA